MKDYGTITVTLILFMIVISLFAVSAEDSKVNLTDDTNKTNESNEALDAQIQPMSLFKGVEVNSTNIDLGNVNADGIERTYPSATTVYVWAWIGNGELRVRATGDFVNIANTSQTIPLNNLQFSTSTVNKRPFSTSNFVIKSYSSTFWDPYEEYIPITFYLRAPLGTDPGVYRTTIFYTVT